MHAPLDPLPRYRPPTILCVDDESGALLIRKSLLEKAGYLVLTAVTARDALEIFSKSKVDLVVSDHLLPGTTGTEMALEMKSAKPAVPILLLSGVLDPPTGREHSDKFVGKAEGPEKLLQAIADLLRYRRFQIDDRNYRAEIACDTLNSPTVWHYIIEQLGSPEIISWSQAPTEEAALAAAKEELNSLNKKL
jgi:DNA-binding NtrC family response regulator